MYMGGMYIYYTKAHTSKYILYRYIDIDVYYFFKSSGRWVKIKLNPPPFHVSDTCRVSIQPDAPFATAVRAAATGHVSMSTRPDPERSGAAEIATRRRPRLWMVWGLRELTH